MNNKKIVLVILAVIFSKTAMSLTQINSITPDSNSLNVGYGYQALNSVVSGAVYNTGVGYQTLYSTTTGINNTALGHQSLYANTTGFDNTAIGEEALRDNTTGEQNTVVGQEAMQLNTTGSFNSAFGQGALNENISGDKNSAFGDNALTSNTTGSNNTAFGYSSAIGNTTGENNTLFGYESGYSNVTGSGNVFIGYQAGYNETGSNKLYIDNSNTSSPLIYGDFDANTLTINGALNVTGDTTILGSLNIKDPSEDGHAASRRYVDKLASISAVLDTRMPAPGKNNRVALNIAGIHNQSAIGLSIVGLFEDDAERAWDYSLGVAASSGDTMTKADIGFSW